MHGIFTAVSRTGSSSVRFFGQLSNQCIVVSSPNEGLNAAADINFDEVVDGGDLGQLLASWGNAPRNPMPPSDCPLGLIQ